MAQHSHSSLRISQVLVRRRWRPLYLLAPQLRLLSRDLQFDLSQ